MQRITQEDLDLNVEVLSMLLERLGMPHLDLRLVSGSKTYGNSFKLWQGSTYAPGTDGGFMGWTKREAYDRLRAMNMVLGDVARNLGV